MKPLKLGMKLEGKKISHRVESLADHVLLSVRVGSSERGSCEWREARGGKHGFLHGAKCRRRGGRCHGGLVARLRVELDVRLLLLLLLLVLTKKEVLVYTCVKAFKISALSHSH